MMTKVELQAENAELRAQLAEKEREAAGWKSHYEALSHAMDSVMSERSLLTVSAVDDEGERKEIAQIEVRSDFEVRNLSGGTVRGEQIPERKFNSSAWEGVKQAIGPITLDGKSYRVPFGFDWSKVNGIEHLKSMLEQG